MKGQSRCCSPFPGGGGSRNPESPVLNAERAHPLGPPRPSAPCTLRGPASRTAAARQPVPAHREPVPKALTRPGPPVRGPVPVPRWTGNALLAPVAADPPGTVRGSGSGLPRAVPGPRGANPDSPPGRRRRRALPLMRFPQRLRVGTEGRKARRGGRPGERSPRPPARRKLRPSEARDRAKLGSSKGSTEPRPRNSQPGLSPRPQRDAAECGSPRPASATRRPFSRVPGESRQTGPENRTHRAPRPQ